MKLLLELTVLRDVLSTLDLHVGFHSVVSVTDVVTEVESTGNPGKRVTTEKDIWERAIFS